MSLQSLVFLCRHSIDWYNCCLKNVFTEFSISVTNSVQAFNRLITMVRVGDLVRIAGISTLAVLDQSSAAALYWQEFMSSPFHVLQRLCWLGLHNLNLLPGHQWTSSSLFTAALWITTLLEENDDQMMPIHLVNLESALSYMTIYCVKGPDFESDFKFWIEPTCTQSFPYNTRTEVWKTAFHETWLFRLRLGFGCA